jgi:putative FmdB family regulatory protein
VPIYEYRCAVCGHRFEVFQKFADAPVEECELCGGVVSKVLHPAALHFKGSGFYTTDYGRSGSKSRASSGAESEGAKAPARDSESKSKAGGAENKSKNGDNGSGGAAESKKASASRVKGASS